MSYTFCEFLRALAAGYAPGAVMGVIIWLIAKKRKAMPLFYADIISFIFPLSVWFVFDKLHWTFADALHNDLCEVVWLGWIWSVAILARLLIPCITHRLRFRLAAIHVGSICTVAAILLALFYA